MLFVYLQIGNRLVSSCGSLALFALFIGTRTLSDLGSGVSPSANTITRHCLHEASFIFLSAHSRSAFLQAPVAFGIGWFDGTVIDCNMNYAGTVGLSVDEMRGKTIRRWVRGVSSCRLFSACFHC